MKVLRNGAWWEGKGTYWSWEAESSKDKIIDNLKRQLKYFEEQKLDYVDLTEKLSKLYHQGIIDSNEDFLWALPNDSEEIDKNSSS